jgi:hypothetical protein
MISRYISSIFTRFIQAAISLLKVLINNMYIFVLVEKEKETKKRRFISPKKFSVMKY